MTRLNHKIEETIDPLTVSVIGLGLIGGSLARAMRSRWERVDKLYAFDTDATMLAQALREGVADMTFALSAQAPEFNLEGSRALADSDLVVICTPVDLIPVYAHLTAKVSDALITDVGSVKKQVMEQTLGLRFVGGHPMAGSERHSFICSDEGLFENAVYVICPQTNFDNEMPVEATDVGETPDDDIWADDVILLDEMIHSIGALPRRMAADEHDRAVAAISHLPHVVAAGLVNTATQEGEAKSGSFMELAAGGFRDVTRIASSDSSLWTNIVSLSRAKLLPILDRFDENMKMFRTALEKEDTVAIQKFFDSASQSRARLSASGGGALMTDALINVEVEDRPGELAVIATLLGVRGISIKNMSIVHARQYEGGRLQLFLSEHHQVALARALLTKAGYECD